MRSSISKRGCVSICQSVFPSVHPSVPLSAHRLGVEFLGNGLNSNKIWSGTWNLKDNYASSLLKRIWCLNYVRLVLFHCCLIDLSSTSFSNDGLSLNSARQGFHHPPLHPPKWLETFGHGRVHIMDNNLLPMSSGVSKWATNEGGGGREEVPIPPRFVLSMWLWTFLDAFSHLYKRVCLSVRPSVRPSHTS